MSALEWAAGKKAWVTNLFRPHLLDDTSVIGDEIERLFDDKNVWSRGEINSANCRGGKFYGGIKPDDTLPYDGPRKLVWLSGKTGSGRSMVGYHLHSTKKYWLVLIKKVHC